MNILLLQKVECGSQTRKRGLAGSAINILLSGFNGCVFLGLCVCAAHANRPRGARGARGVASSERERSLFSSGVVESRKKQKEKKAVRQKKCEE